MPKFSVEGGSLTVSIISGNEKVSIGGGAEYQDFPSKNVCLTVPWFSVEELFSVSLFPGTEKVWIREGGVSRFSVGTLLSHSTEKLHRGILLCFRKYLVSKKFKEERGREYQDFPSKIFCLAVPKNFVGESFSASLFSGMEKFYASERGEVVSRFSVENFLSHGVENFHRGNPLVFD